MLSKTEDNYLKQDASGEEWGLALGGRHYPHFLKLTWIYELPIAYYGRTYAEGKKITWRDGFKAIRVLLGVRLFG